MKTPAPPPDPEKGKGAATTQAPYSKTPKYRADFNPSDAETQVIGLDPFARFKAVWAACIRPTSRKLVLLAMTDFANADGTSIFPAIETIARYCNISTNQARTHVKALLALGVIRVTRGAAHERATTYALDFFALASIPATESERGSTTLKHQSTGNRCTTKTAGKTTLDYQSTGNWHHAQVPVDLPRSTSALDPTRVITREEEGGGVRAPAAPGPSPALPDWWPSAAWGALTTARRGANSWLGGLVAEAVQAYNSGYSPEDIAGQFRYLAEHSHCKELRLRPRRTYKSTTPRQKAASPARVRALHWGNDFGGEQ